MINKETYDKLIPYKPILEMFSKHREYVGGADGMIPIYESAFGVQLNRSCQDCFADMLTICWIEITKYEKENGSTNR